MRRPDVKVPGPVPLTADLPGGLDKPAMADLTRPIKPRSRDRSHAGISHERLARRSYAPCPRFWRLLFDPRSFRDTRRLKFRSFGRRCNPWLNLGFGGSSFRAIRGSGAPAVRVDHAVDEGGVRGVDAVSARDERAGAGGAGEFVGCACVSVSTWPDTRSGPRGRRRSACWRNGSSGRRGGCPCRVGGGALGWGCSVGSFCHRW